MDVVEHGQLTLEEATRHWYYQTKFRVLQTHLRRHRFFESGKTIADVGCGLGVFMKMLSETPDSRGTRLFGVDPAYDEKTEIGEDLAIHPKWPGMERTDGVLLMDVLEHVEHPRNLLANSVRHCRNGGLVFITVPAFQSLWSQHDVALGHYRRYNIQTLRADIEAIDDLELVDTHYFFASVLPVAMLVRAIKKHASGADNPCSDMHKLPTFWNGLLKLCCLPEIPLMRMNKLGGLSVAAVCRVGRKAPITSAQPERTGIDDIVPLPELSISVPSLQPVEENKPVCH